MITNALDSMNDKGTLVLETVSRNGSVIIRVSDTGSGISPENMVKDF